MSILSKRAIEAQMSYGNIVIDPFHPEQMGPNSYDLHLGDKLKILTCDIFDNIDPKKDISGNYEDCDLYEQPDGIKYFQLHPGFLYLGVTHEYTESRAHVPVMEGKSSLGRMGVETHVCAGMGDVGFCGYWTLEIRVTVPTILYPGMPIGQIIWYDVSGATDADYSQTGSYNNVRGEAVPGIPNLWKKMHQFLAI